MSIRRIVSCFLVLLFAPLVLHAQGTTSRIAGIVTDPTGALVPGAKITAINEGTNSSYVTMSGQKGTYNFDSLQIGKYTVRVEAAGFKQFISTGNVLSIGLPTTVNATLQLGESSQTVQVTGGYDLIQTESSGNFGTIIDNKTLTELPIVGSRGRSPLTLINTVPGVVDNGANAVGGGVSVNGSRDRAWNYTLDGIDVNESSSGGSNNSPVNLNPDAIAEFRVITSNFTAEYGRNSGGQVTMVSKSGTNKFHGGAFWFYQSPFLQANDPANKAATPQQGRAQFVQNIGGGSIGGPIIKDNTFFFLNVQMLHTKQSEVVTRRVYTSIARTGLFRYVTSGRNQPYGTSGASVDINGNPVAATDNYDMVANDPQHIGLDPSVLKYMGLESLPNDFAVGDGLNIAGYTFTAPEANKQVDVFFKLDHTFNANNAVFVRWYSGHQNTYGDAANGGLQMFPGLPNVVNTLRAPRNLAINYRWTPTANTTNELVVGMNRFGYSFINPDITSAALTPYNFNNVVSPYSSYYDNSRFLTTYQLVDNFALQKNTHLFKFGINFRYGREIDHRGSIGALNAKPQVLFDTADNPVDTATFNLPSNINSTYDLPTLQSSINDLLGRIGQLQAGYVSAHDSQSFQPAGSILNMDHRWPEYDFYAQDTWKVLPNLVFDYGVRLDARFAPTLKGFPGLVPNQSVLFGLQSTDSLTFVPGKFYKNDWNNFGPSVGLAWDPFKNGKTSVRAHYRVAYDRINPFSFSSSIFQGMPGLTYQVIDTTAGQNGLRAQDWAPPAPPVGVTPEQLRQPPAYSLNTVTVADPNMRTPKVYMWGLSIQQYVAPNTVFTVSYIGNHGVGLYGGYDANQAHYRSNGFLTAFQAAQNGQQSALLDQIYSTDTRRRSGESGTDFVKREYPSYFTLNNVAGLAGITANRLQSGVPLVVSSGLSPYFFKPYPQYLGGMHVLDTRDYSNYNGLQAQLEHRFSAGLHFLLSYVWSKSQDVASFDPTFTTVASGASQSAAATPFDIRKPRLNYGPSDFDRTSVIQSNWVYDLPFGRGMMFGSHWNRWMDAALGGWEIAGDAVWETGRPITFYSGANTFSSVVQTPASCTGQCSPYMGHIHHDTASGQQFYFTPEQKARLYTPAAGDFSNLGRNYFRQARIYNVDATLAKTFHILEGQTLQARLEAQNLTNSEMYDTFGSQAITSSVFTRLNQAVDGVMNNSARRMQLSLKYNF